MLVGQEIVMSDMEPSRSSNRYADTPESSSAQSRLPLANGSQISVFQAGQAGSDFTGITPVIGMSASH